MNNSYINIELNKEQVFLYFLDTIRYPGLASKIKGFEIPEYLIKNGNLLTASFLECILSPSKIKLYFKAKKTFGILFSKYENELKKLKDKIDSSKEILEWARKETELETKEKWPFEKINIYPVIANWAASKDNNIFVGIKPIMETDAEIPLLIHELLHLNLSNFKFPNINFPRDVEELLIVFLTRKISGKLGEKFNLTILKQSLLLPQPFKNLENYENQVAQIFKESETITKTIISIDTFLKSTGHKKIYG